MWARQKGHSGGFLLTSHRRVAQGRHSLCRQDLMPTSCGSSRQMPHSGSSAFRSSKPKMLAARQRLAEPSAFLRGCCRPHLRHCTT